MPRLATPLRTIRVALLVCGELAQNVVAKHGDLLSVYRRWLNKSLPRYSGARLVMHGYDVTQMKYPKEPQLPQYDVVMLTGSPGDAWGEDPWIRRLVSYMQHVGDKHSNVKIYGICFGHQIVSRALGGTVQRNAQGWELGSTTVNMTKVGQMLLGAQEVNLQQVHQDHSPLSSHSSSLTSGDIHLLGYTENTDNHGLVKFYSYINPDYADQSYSGHLLKHVHVITVQGHPEFTDTLTADITRELHGKDANNIRDGIKAVGDAERNVHGLTTNASRIDENEVAGLRKDDGVDIVGKAFWRMFGIQGGNIRKRRFLP
ncbi:Putative glutamine amidotransferase-like protein C13C5.04 [Leucoagaricus sp. SymC.cos]|nr:Putative glutamine amidotransferase-like protein C13C5.04 [Leucoagaricus sp. SymC.cos]